MTAPPFLTGSGRNRAKPPILGVGPETRRAERPVAAFSRRGGVYLPRPLESPEGQRPSPSVPPSAGHANPPNPCRPARPAVDQRVSVRLNVTLPARLGGRC